MLNKALGSEPSLDKRFACQLQDMAPPRKTSSLLPPEFVRKLMWAACHVHCVHLPKRLRMALVLRLEGRRRRMIKSKTAMIDLTTYDDPSDVHTLTQPASAPLLLACQQGSMRQVRHQLDRASAQGPEQLKELLDSQHPVTGDTALSLACVSDVAAESKVRLLLETGASAYVYDNLEVSPLIKASRAGHVGIVKVLLEEGEADAFHMTPSGRTALMEAAAEGRLGVAEVLLEAGADARQSCDQSGHHALLDAVGAGQLDVVKVLLGGGGKVNQGDKEGNTALLLAARLGDEGCCRYLLHAGAKMIAHYLTRRTPLMEAACYGYLPVVQLLLKQATLEDVQAVDSHGHQAVDLAGRPEVREVIRTWLTDKLAASTSTNTNIATA